MERISALMDGEFDHDEAASVVRQIRERSELREAWSTYHLIGDAMRGERCPDTRLMQAVTAKLAAEPPILAPKRRVGESIRRIALPSLAAAAAVASVTWISLETFQGSQNSAPVAQVVVPLSPIVDSAPTLGSLIQPAAHTSPPPQIQLPSRRIDAYLEAHQEFSPSRTIQGLASYARTVSATAGVEAGR